MSSQYQSCPPFSFRAPSAVPARRFVDRTGAVGSADGNTAGVNTFAISAGDATAAKYMEVIPNSSGMTAIVEFGGAVNPGGLIKCGAAGVAVAHDSTNPKVAYLAPWEDAKASGDFGEVVLLDNA